MKSKAIAFIAAMVFLFNCPAMAQNRHEDTLLTKPQKTITRGTVNVEGKQLNYEAVAGTLILKNTKDTATCSMFYTAYFKSGESDPSKRPVTFIYNGGPGSATIWLHIGAWGPQRVYANDTARTMAPYRTVNNDYSLLDASDLVFIDAPGTGGSRIVTKDKGGAGDPKDFYGIDPDAKAFSSFITNFLSTFNRWNSPKYLFGESYGTFRSAVVANILENEGVDLNGVVLLSQLLSYNNMSDAADMDPGNDLRYELALPSCAATAWYHHKLANQNITLEALVKEVEEFSLNEYAVALAKGSLLQGAEYNNIVTKLHNYTGLPEAYIRKANLRINGPQMEKTLLADEGQVTGRLDTRFRGYDMDPLAKTPDYDPHGATFEAAFIGAFNTYLRTTLNYGKDQEYHAFGDNIIGQWDFRHLVPGSGFRKAMYANVMPDLARAMIFNPKLKVQLNMSYYDLGTPFFEGIYEMHHLPIPEALQNNISYNIYKSGHMVYLNMQALKELHDNVAKFIGETH
ncbi:MAG: peptidase S10 [Bacteroidetes bacterium]|nr:peptidase S10 [Bacteroidota bacterium]